VAIRLFVEPTLDLRAVAKTNSLRVVAPQFRAASIVVTRPLYAATLAYPLYQTTIDYRRLINSIYFRDMQAAEIVLDPDTKNRYFKDQDFVSFLDAAALGVSKAQIDSLTLSDAPALHYSTTKSDQFGFSDNAIVTITFNREFSDSFAHTDVTSWSVNKGVSDSFTQSDTINFKDFEKTSADVAAVADAPAVIAFSRISQDGFTVTDLYNATIIYNRGFSETITALSDTRPVFDLGLGPAEQIPILESLSYDYDALASDQATVADASSIDYSRPEADGVSTSDTFDRVVVFSRAFSDAFTLDDNATVGGVIKDTQAVKTNVFGFSDTHAYSFGKELGDAFTFADVTSRINEKILDDSVSIVESLIISKSSAASSVFNAAAFNIAPLNN
jgi:hypothetical protein